MIKERIKEMFDLSLFGGLEDNIDFATGPKDCGETRESW